MKTTTNTKVNTKVNTKANTKVNTKVNTKANTKVNTTAETTAVSFGFDTTADNIFNKLLSKKELDELNAVETYDKIECDGKVGYMKISTRNYFIDAYKKSETLANSSEWASRMVISATMANETYKDSFVSDTDFANQIGQSKAFISKAKDAVLIRDWLIRHGYGEEWKPSTVEELITIFKDFNKKKFDFTQFMKATGLQSTATVKAVRDAKKAYNESLVSKKETKSPITTTSVSQAVTSPVTTTSVSQAVTSPITTTSVSQAVTSPVTTTSVSQAVGKVKDDVDAMTANDVKTKLGFNSMSIVLNFNGIEPIKIELTDEHDRKLANTILTVLTSKIKEQLKK